MILLWLIVFATIVAPSPAVPVGQKPERPNILFAIADDWSYPHAGAYGNK